MDLATGPLSGLLPKLAKLLQNEYNLQKSARKGIEFLHKELEFMHAALHKVGEVPREQLEEPQRIWARDVRELSCDMEDIVDTFMVDVEGPDPPSKKGVKKIFKNMIRKVNKAMARREVAQEINDIKERAKELAERHERCKVDGIAPAMRIPVDPRLHALYTEATKIVGIEEAKEEVITMLTGGDDDAQKKRIVSIAGFGGLGKTTLAKAVHDEIERKFDCTAFVSVSRDPDTQKLLKDMLYQLDGKHFEDIHSKMLDERFLIDKAIKFLENKRYLIVIDDIWSKEPWDKVIGLALIMNKGSRIITTTRIIDVAEHIGGFYRIKPLSDESSETLFYGRIFGSKDHCPSQFSEVSKKILKKCGGVPLAIVTTSSMLANKSENIKVWNDVCDSIGSGLGRNPGMDDMRKILLLSYYDLPFHLRTCLLYLSIFPEDHVISKDRLIWRWVAEGFVQKNQQGGDQSLLEVGENYFNELVNRSLIQTVDMDFDGTPQACRVHDTVLDIIISLSTEECFITTVSGDRGKCTWESKVRRLSLHDFYSSDLTMNMPKLRSLTIFTPYDPFSMPSSSCYYHLLRVLDLGGCRFVKPERDLGFVGSLAHLRYLGLSSINGKYYDTGLGPDRLPDVEIGKLRFLQTLDLSGTGVRELPSSIIGLRQLVRLRGCRSGLTMLPDGLKNLTSLEVLQGVAVVSKCIAEELGHLTQLRVLDLQFDLPDDGSAFTKALVESLLGKLNKIESLHIRSMYFYRTPDMECSKTELEPLGNLYRLCIGAIKVLPTWIEPAFLPVLSYLDIEVRFERWGDIRVLGLLPCLCHLKFQAGSYVADQGELELEAGLFLAEPGELEIRSVVGPDAFPSLVRCDLKFRGCSQRRVAPCMFPRGAMPRLEELSFRIDLEDFCSGTEFTVDNLALAHFPSLRSVTVCLDGELRVPKEVTRSVIEKLEHEAAVHPNHPLRIHFR
ncbi:unnamed protein product [Urochloa decumbens]|uniref:Uncharacterized protein n=1 Tax=Urochloa decumbens TaxID=240449 RepID=A0ABC8W9F5_9POAL